MLDETWLLYKAAIPWERYPTVTILRLPTDCTREIISHSEFPQPRSNMKPNVSRRKFLAGTVAAAAVAPLLKQTARADRGLQRVSH